MATETVLIGEIIMNWKQLMLAFGGFIVRILWVWERPIKWPRILAGFIFMFVALYFNQKHTSHDYREVVAALVGLFTNNIITTLFRWYNVNEDALMRKTKSWWNSDSEEHHENKKPGND